VLGTPLHLAPAPGRLVLLAERAVRHGAGSDPADALRARASAELAVAELLEIAGTTTPAAAVPADRRRGLVLRAIAELEDRYAEPLDLPALAALVHVSPQHLAKQFRAVLQVTPTAYLRALRLSRARRLITLTDEPITSIAYSCGFTSPAHLSRAYSARYGEPPTAARRSGAAVPAPTV
jgi:transcriptional regulator GlxA family with amidase domain